MSIFSCNILNSFKMPTSSQTFNFKYQAPAAAAAVNAKTAEKSIKKRKRTATIKVQNTAYHMQLAIDQLMLVLTKKTDQITTTIAAAKNAEKQSKTATKTADKTASKSYAQVAISNSQEQNWQLVQNKKKTATVANKAANANAKSASFSYKEKRLILLE